MKSLSTQLEEYLELRHQMGFDLRVAGRLLRKFVLFAQEKGASFITKEVALTWATQPADCQPGHWANRLAMVRGFAEYSSAIALDRKDVDLDRGLLIIRHSKFNKSRLIPVHDTTQKELRAYERVRDRIFPHPNSPSFFISERGTRLTGCTVRIWFITVSRRIGLRGPTDRRGPRLHDLRHRFAYKTILSWYKRGMDVEAHLPRLATYLGHGHVADTYWYISAVPELLRVVTERLERRKSAHSS